MAIFQKLHLKAGLKCYNFHRDYPALCVCVRVDPAAQPSGRCGLGSRRGCVQTRPPGSQRGARPGRQAFEFIIGIRPVGPQPDVVKPRHPMRLSPSAVAEDVCLPWGTVLFSAWTGRVAVSPPMPHLARPGSPGSDYVASGRRCPALELIKQAPKTRLLWKTHAPSLSRSAPKKPCSDHQPSSI